MNKIIETKAGIREYLTHYYNNKLKKSYFYTDRELVHLLDKETVVEETPCETWTYFSIRHKIVDIRGRYFGFYSTTVYSKNEHVSKFPVATTNIEEFKRVIRYESM